MNQLKASANRGRDLQPQLEVGGGGGGGPGLVVATGEGGRQARELPATRSGANQA